jgi:hypothetical protein
MDYWSSKTGIIAKKIFYKNKYLGIPLAFWGLLLENFFPTIQKFYSQPHREVIGDAHYALAFLNLYELTDKLKYLHKAESFLKIMSEYSSNGYSGLCWGYSFGWQESKNVFWEPGIPLITITPYPFWAYKKHFELTNNQESYNHCLSITDFALHDLNEKIMPNGTVCSSYSPIGQDIVINANTYRAALLADAYKLSKNDEYKVAAIKNIDFVLSYQEPDGKWYYEAKGSNDNFIDHFHTCFILKNLWKCYLVLNDEDILAAIKKGYDYYKNNLFYSNGRPKHFSISKYPKLRKYEMYDYAEGISLGVLLKNNIPGALDTAIILAEDLINNFQLRDGHFITRVTSFGTKHKIPYHRWPQAQLFYALTLLYKEFEKA